MFLAGITLSCCATWGCCRRGLSLAGAATSIIFFATKVVCHDKTRLLSRQKYACRDKHILSRLAYFCREKHVFVASKIFFRTNIILSRQAYFCRDKRCILSQQKLYLWQLPPVIEVAQQRDERDSRFTGYTFVVII